MRGQRPRVSNHCRSCGAGRSIPPGQHALDLLIRDPHVPAPIAQRCPSRWWPARRAQRGGKSGQQRAPV
jgi:hypothetical protein